MRRAGIVVITLSAALGCRSARSVPEAGAFLLQVSCKAEAPAPDELRAWIYDDGGALWDGVSLQGSQPAGCSGSVLLQPGTFQGKLRVHLRAYAASARVLDGLVTIDPANGSRTVPLVLDPALPPDTDHDDVPDAIDDCPVDYDPLQRGCGGLDAGAPDTAPADVVAPDAAPDVPGEAPPVDLGTADAGDDAAAPLLAQGAQCTSGAQCASGSCVDGVCCTNVCAGPCRSCNQPSAVGVCQGYAAGIDPESECASGTACNGVGACGPVSTEKLPNGQLCTAGTQCTSGYCTDGVCCNSACNAACQTCGTGTCTAVLRTDDVPECAGTMTCNPKGKCVTR